MITVIGVGMESGDITAKAKRAIKNADEVYSRAPMRRKTVVLGKMFAECASYEELDEKIAEFLVERSNSGANIAFLSVGDGFSDTAIKKLEGKTEVEFISGVADCRAKMPCSSYLTFSAYDIDECLEINTRLPLIVYQIDDKFVAGDVKLWLMKFYPVDYPVTLASGKSVENITLEELDRVKIGQASSIFLAASDNLLEKKRFGWNDLLFVMKKLTDPDGCPWDRAQTHESICINMIEEAYEAVDAVKKNDPENLCEELGDVILQSVFHADMSKREGDFDINDVLTRLCTKLVTRHTHIFGENKADGAEEALYYWEKAKAKEKSYSSFTEQIERLPDTFPGSLMLQKFVKKANKSGAKVTAEFLREKIAEEVQKNTPESAKNILTLSVFLASVEGLDAEVAMLDSFRELKEQVGDNAEALSEKL